MKIIYCIVWIVFACSLLSHRSMVGSEQQPPLVIVGGGWLDAGVHHSGGIIQGEYRWSGWSCWHYIRPQLVVLVPGFHSIYVGVGACLELYLSEHLVFSPSFSPGLYYKGKGRDLGYPLEFRSSLELCYEFENKMRIGGQFYHLSNASLSHKNPGMNALVVIFSFPLGKN